MRTGRGAPGAAQPCAGRTRTQTRSPPSGAVRSPRPEAQALIEAAVRFVRGLDRRREAGRVAGGQAGADDQRGQALAPAVRSRADGREVPVGPGGAERAVSASRASTASSRSPKRAADPSSRRVRRTSLIGVRPGFTQAATELMSSVTQVLPASAPTSPA